MAIKTFINGQENGVITYLGDTEPCAVYVNGERQDNISYIPTSAEGVDSATYTSEYKNNLRTLQIEGNTEQPSSANLYDISKVNGATPANTTTPDVAGDATYGTVTDGVLNLKRAYYDRGIIWTGAKIPIKQGGNYYISTDIYIDQSIVTTATKIVVALKNITKQTMSQNRVSSQITVRDTWVECSFDAISIPSDWVGDDVYLLLQVSGDATQYFNLPVYAKNIMISYGEAKPYEPYLPPISIANPRAITNCGNGQIEVDVRGANLFALGESNYTVGKVHTNAGITYTVQADGGIHCKGTKTSSFSYFIFMGAYIRNYGQGTYSLSVYGENIPSKITIEFRRLNASGTSVQTGLASVGNPLTRTLVEGETLERFSVIVSTEGEVDFVVYPMLNIGEPLPYQPYFNSTVSIPANVVLESGANDTLLELAKIGDIADTITIDRVNNKVKYIQRICRVRPFVNVGGTLEYGGTSGGNPDEWFFSLNKNAQVGIGKCEFSPIVEDLPSENEYGVVIFDTVIIINTPKSLGLNSPDALESYLMQTGNSDLSIFYALETPIEWTVDNISDTELKAQFEDLSNSLLEWAKNTKNQTNIIEITSTPSVTKTSVNYAKWGGVPNENNT